MTVPENVRVNANVPFPALVTGTGPIAIGKVNGIWTVGFSIAVLSSIVPLSSSYATDYLLLWDSIAGVYYRVSLNTIGASGARAQRYVSAGPVVIAGSDQVLTLNLPSPQNIALPASATRNGVPLTFYDVGGQFAANNVTLVPNGAETINGLATWTLGTNHQSITLNPFNDGTNAGWFVT